MDWLEVALSGAEYFGNDFVPDRVEAGAFACDELGGDRESNAWHRSEAGFELPCGPGGVDGTRSSARSLSSPIAARRPLNSSARSQSRARAAGPPADTESSVMATKSSAVNLLVSAARVPVESHSSNSAPV